VQVLTSDGTVETRTVEVGLMTDSMAEITNGVAAGESVVTGSSSDQVTTDTTQTNTNVFGGGVGPGQMPPSGAFPGGPGN
jgi:hypothetical protein